MRGAYRPDLGELPDNETDTMKTKYRFIHFTQFGRIWNCLNNSSHVSLGTCYFYAPWKQWVFSQSGPDCVFSADCLRDIAHFMGQLKAPDGH